MFQITPVKSFWSGWNVEVSMILDGKAGQVLALAPLLPCLTMEHPIESAGLVAVCLSSLVTIRRRFLLRVVSIAGS